MEKILYQRMMEFSSEDTGFFVGPFILCGLFCGVCCALYSVRLILWRLLCPLFCVAYSMTLVVFFVLRPSFGILCLTAGLVFSVFRQLGVVEVAVHVDFVRNCDDRIAKQNVPLGVIG